MIKVCRLLIISNQIVLGTSSSQLVFVTSQPWNLEASTLANERSIAFDVDIPRLEEFDEYMAQLSTLSGNAWFDEFYEALYQCNLRNSFSTPSGSNFHTR